MVDNSVDIPLLDRFSALHFAVGAICFYYNINLVTSIIIHSIWEINENTDNSILVKFYNELEKTSNEKNVNKLTRIAKIAPYQFKKESFRNSWLGDTLAFTLGWCLASYFFYKK
jgi:hypothetical protein